ncbi:hypothetical protein [Eubacterium sp. ER2]|uniref:hypothetical protein n=1 Tax=Eubacterium sp. ER2 TaxID=1519438 RepID=UPI0018CD357B|nr:hypothetical protein [Eubacterium sp. ER2]
MARKKESMAEVFDTRSGVAGLVFFDAKYVPEKAQGGCIFCEDGLSFWPVEPLYIIEGRIKGEKGVCGLGFCPDQKDEAGGRRGL